MGMAVRDGQGNKRVCCDVVDAEFVLDWETTTEPGERGAERKAEKRSNC